MEQYRTPQGGEDYLQAIGSVRCAKNCFVLVILLSLVIQLVGVVLVRYVDVAQLAKQEATPAAKEAEATTKPAAKVDEEAEVSEAPRGFWYTVLQWALPTTKFTAMAASLLLALALLLAIKLALLERTGGVAALVSAFFWSLLLAMFLIPWQQALPGSAFLRGATFNMGDLVADTRRLYDTSSWGTKLLYYARFMAYPIFAGLLTLIVQAKFGRGYRRMTLGVDVSEGNSSLSGDQKI